MKKNKIILLVLTIAMFLPTLILAEEKEIKFITSNGICVFDAVQVKEAIEYLPESINTEIRALKLALTFLQLKSFQVKPFSDVDCAIKYFYETLRSSVKSENLLRGYGIAEDLKPVAKDFVFALEKIRSNEKYSKEISQTLSKSSSFKEYYDLYKYYPEFLESLDEANARLVFEEVVTQIKNGTITSEEWNQIFRLYFKKKIPPPPHVKEYISFKLLRTYGTNNSNFLNSYFSLIDDFSYNSFFKDFFDGIPTNELGYKSFLGDFNWKETLPKIYDSKYFSESFKCRLAKEVIPSKIQNFKLSDYDSLRKINHPCLKQSLSFLDHFKESANSCPEILLKPGDNTEEILKNASVDFTSKWLDCRKQCNVGDACIEANEGTANYLNSKFAKDKNIFSMLSENSRFSRMRGATFLNYKVKSSGACDKNVCKENLKSCTDTDLVAKVEQELKDAHLKDCKADTDCFPFYFAEDCSMTTVNQQQPNMAIWSFPSERLVSLKKQCGNLHVVIVPAHICERRKGIDPQKIKCESNYCVVK